MNIKVGLGWKVTPLPSYLTIFTSLHPDLASVHPHDLLFGIAPLVIEVVSRTITLGQHTNIALAGCCAVRPDSLIALAPTLLVVDLVSFVSLPLKERKKKERKMVN